MGVTLVTADPVASRSELSQEEEGCRKGRCSRCGHDSYLQGLGRACWFRSGCERLERACAVGQTVALCCGCRVQGRCESKWRLKAEKIRKSVKVSHDLEVRNCVSVPRAHGFLPHLRHSCTFAPRCSASSRITSRTRNQLAPARDGQAWGNTTAITATSS